METHEFDALSRALAGTPSRRAAGRALIGLALGVAFSPLLGLADAEARRRKKKKRKKCRNCGTGRYCEKGKCEACKPLESACTADVQCC